MFDPRTRFADLRQRRPYAAAAAARRRDAANASRTAASRWGCSNNPTYTTGHVVSFSRTTCSRSTATGSPRLRVPTGVPVRRDRPRDRPRGSHHDGLSGCRRRRRPGGGSRHTDAHKFADDLHDPPAAPLRLAGRRRCLRARRRIHAEGYIRATAWSHNRLSRMIGDIRSGDRANAEWYQISASDLPHCPIQITPD